MKLVVWLSGRRVSDPERDTPAVVVELFGEDAEFVEQELATKDDRTTAWGVDVDDLIDYVSDINDRRMAELLVSAGQFSDWMQWVDAPEV